jgi:hypothetical protein
MPTPAAAPSAEFCDFCDKSQKEVRILQGGRSNICAECIRLCNEILDDSDDRLYARLSDILDAIALSGEPQPYSAVAPILGLGPRDRRLHHLLGRSLCEDHAASRPLRASLIFNKTLGMPGAGYFEVCRTLGYNIPPSNEAQFWSERLGELSS